MARYIDAEKLEELCDIMADKCDGIGQSIWEQFRTTVEWSPTADVQEVKRGRWIYWDKNRVICSECKLEPYAGKGADSFKYCPNCGADMR